MYQPGFFDDLDDTPRPVRGPVCDPRTPELLAADCELDDELLADLDERRDENEYAADVYGLEEAGEPDPWMVRPAPLAATQTEPQTDGRVTVYADRHAGGYALWHPDDRAGLLDAMYAEAEKAMEAADDDE